MIDKFRKIFGSVIKSLELVYVIEDAKPAARIMVNDEIFDKVKDFLNKYKLHVTKSDFKVRKDDAGDYSDKGSKIDVNEKGYYFMYLSKSKEKAEKAKKLEAENDHINLGMTLGYPKCCCEFFNKNFEIESKNKNDFTLTTLRESENYKFPFYNNIAARHFDISLLNHFPCNFNCKESMKIAEKNLKIIKKYSNEWGLIVEGILRSSVLYTRDCVFLLRDFKLDNNKLFYKNIMSNVSNELYRKLKDADFIEIIDKNRIKIGDEEIKDIGVMVFI